MYELGVLCPFQQYFSRIKMMEAEMSISTGPSDRTRQNLGRSDKISFRPDGGTLCPACKLPVKHASLYRVCHKFC